MFCFSYFPSFSVWEPIYSRFHASLLGLCNSKSFNICNYCFLVFWLISYKAIKRSSIRMKDELKQFFLSVIRYQVGLFWSGSIRYLLEADWYYVFLDSPLSVLFKRLASIKNGLNNVSFIFFKHLIGCKTILYFGLFVFMLTRFVISCAGPGMIFLLFCLISSVLKISVKWKLPLRFLSVTTVLFSSYTGSSLARIP